jgi:hypothetical protein
MRPSVVSIRRDWRRIARAGESSRLRWRTWTPGNGIALLRGGLEMRRRRVVHVRGWLIHV